MTRPGKGSIRVFVYGTLKRFHYNHYLLEDNNVKGTMFLGRAKLNGPFRMLSLRYYPGVQYLPDPKVNAPLYGEVYAISQDTLRSLDILEGNGQFFERKKIPTPFGNAWCYFIPSSDAFAKDRECISSGVWHPTNAETDFINSGAESQPGDVILPEDTDTLSNTAEA